MLNVSGLELSGLFIVFMLVVGCVMKSSRLVRISERETFLFFNICIYYRVSQKKLGLAFNRL